MESQGLEPCGFPAGGGADRVRRRGGEAAAPSAERGWFGEGAGGRERARCRVCRGARPGRPHSRTGTAGCRATGPASRCFAAREHSPAVLSLAVLGSLLIQIYLYI